MLQTGDKRGKCKTYYLCIVFKVALMQLIAIKAINSTVMGAIFFRIRNGYLINQSVSISEKGKNAATHYCTYISMESYY